MFSAHVTQYCHDILQSTYMQIPCEYGNHLVSCIGDPLAQSVKHDTSQAKIMGSFPRECMKLHIKWLYIKVAAKYKNVNVNLHLNSTVLSLDTITAPRFLHSIFL